MKSESIFRTWLKTPARARANGSVSDLSVEIIKYALDLATDSKELRQLQSAAKALGRAPRGEAAAAKLYLDIEAHLIEHKRFTQEKLRQQIWREFNLVHARSGMPLLFAPDLMRDLKLCILVINEILGRVGKHLAMGQLSEIVNDTVKGSPLEGVVMSGAGLDLSAIEVKIERQPASNAQKTTNAMSRIFRALAFELRSVQGEQSLRTVAEAYAQVKRAHAPFIQDIARIAILLPEGVLEEEKLSYLSRGILEQEVRQKTDQLEAQKASIEQQIRERTEQLSEAEAKLVATIESLPQGMVMVGADGEVLMHNAAAEKVLRSQGESWRLRDIAKPFGGKIDLEAAVAEVQTKAKSLEVTDINYGAKILRLQLTPVLSNDRVLGVLMVVENITAIKILERTRDEFFSIASHELRTPLTAIKGNASMLLDYYKDQLKDPNVREMVEDIHESSVRLIELVNDFLDASRLEQGRIQFKLEQFGIERVLEQVVYEMGAVLKQKDLYLKINKGAMKLDSLPQIYADVNRTKQVVYNLVGNALKFTNKGGITVKAEKRAGFVRMLVTDTGVGMTPEQQKLLFHKFQQTGAELLTRDTTRGTGLGLYISKLLVEGMGGKMGVLESKPGVGTTFFFTLATHPPREVPATGSNTSDRG
jgi:signal transduction histidine kinase